MRLAVRGKLRRTLMFVQEIQLLLLTAFFLTEASKCPSKCSCSDSYGELVVGCGGRGLTKIPEHISSSVVWLDLKYNNISKITSKGFKDLTHVQGINLSHNKIDRISEDAFKHLKHLDNIDLSENLLTTISYDVFAVPIKSAVKEARNVFVNLALNPWLCDCNLAWLAEIIKNGSHVFSSRLLECNSPEALKGLDVTDVKVDTLTCPAASIAPLHEQDENSYHYSPYSRTNLIALCVPALFIVAVVVFAARKWIKRKDETKYERLPMSESRETLV